MPTPLLNMFEKSITIKAITDIGMITEVKDKNRLKTALKLIVDVLKIKPTMVAKIISIKRFKRA